MSFFLIHRHRIGSGEAERLPSYFLKPCCDNLAWVSISFENEDVFATCNVFPINAPHQAVEEPVDFLCTHVNVVARMGQIAEIIVNHSHQSIS